MCCAYSSNILRFCASFVRNTPMYTIERLTHAGAAGGDWLQSVARLPRDVILHEVFAQLEGPELLQCCVVCSEWNSWIGTADEELWKPLCQRYSVLSVCVSVCLCVCVSVCLTDSVAGSGVWRWSCVPLLLGSTHGCTLTRSWQHNRRRHWQLHGE